MSLLGAARIPETQQLGQLHAQPSLGQSCTGESLVSMHAGPLQLVQLFATLWTVACQASLSGRGVLQARIQQRIGHYWLPCAPRAPYFLLPELPTPLSTWCCQNPCGQSSPTTSTPGPLRGKPKSSRAASGANPVDDPHAEVEIEPRLKLRGSVAKEEDPNLPTSCTSGRLNPQDPLRRLCPWRCERLLRAPTGESALALTAVGGGGENTQESTLESELPPEQVQTSTVLEGPLGR